MSTGLREHYLGYLAVLNERRFADLGGYVAEQLTYNGTPLSLADYRRARADEVEAIPDLHFDASLIVADATHVAAVLGFRCTPVRPFLGHEPTGAAITFTEHVFYRFSSERPADARIVDVVSLLDTGAIDRQLGGPR